MRGGKREGAGRKRGSFRGRTTRGLSTIVATPVADKVAFAAATQGVTQGAWVREAVIRRLSDPTESIFWPLPEIDTTVKGTS